MKKIANRIKINWKYMIIFSVMAMAIGWVAPKMVAQYMPAAFYYEIIGEPITEKAEYRPGDTVKLIFTRKSIVNVSGSETLEMSIVRIDGGLEIVETIKRVVSLEKGTDIVVVPFKLNKDLETGVYQIRGIIEFEVEKIPKSVPFKVPQFRVI